MPSKPPGRRYPSGRRRTAAREARAKNSRATGSGMPLRAKVRRKSRTITS